MSYSKQPTSTPDNNLSKSQKAALNDAHSLQEKQRTISTFLQKLYEGAVPLLY